MQSVQGLLGTRCGTNGRNPENGKNFKILAIAKQVLKVAISSLFLGRKYSPPPMRKRGTR
jgi:hypothetical protein